MPNPHQALCGVLSLAARLLLEGGAETYRVEETVRFIAVRQGAADAQVLALPTGCFYTLTFPDGTQTTQVVRVHNRGTNLHLIDGVNKLSRGLSSGSLTLRQGGEGLEALRNAPRQPLWLGVLGGAMAAGFFALLFGGGWFELAVAAVCGALACLVAAFSVETLLFSALQLFASGVLSALVAKTSLLFYPQGLLSAILIGAIMPMVPGMLVTNAVRDTVSGDLVSGLARAAEAILRSLAIAAGVGVVLALWR